MRKGIVVLIALLWVATGVMSFGLWKMYDEAVPTVYAYEGKVLMTEVEYSAFKMVVARDEVRIVKMIVYSSEIPLVVFKVTVPADVEFRWGERVPTAWKYGIPVWGHVPLLVGAVMVGMFGLILLGREIP